MVQATAGVSRGRVEQLYLLHRVGKLSDDQLIAYANGYDPFLQREFWKVLHELAQSDRRLAADARLDELEPFYWRLLVTSTNGSTHRVNITVGKAPSLNA